MLCAPSTLPDGVERGASSRFPELASLCAGPSPCLATCGVTSTVPPLGVQCPPIFVAGFADCAALPGVGRCLLCGLARSVPPWPPLLLPWLGGLPALPHMLLTSAALPVSGPTLVDPAWTSSPSPGGLRVGSLCLGRGASSSSADASGALSGRASVALSLACHRAVVVVLEALLAAGCLAAVIVSLALDVSGPSWRWSWTANPGP